MIAFDIVIRLRAG